MADESSCDGTPIDEVEGGRYTYNAETSTRYVQDCQSSDSTSYNNAVSASVVGLSSPKDDNANLQIPVSSREAYNRDYLPVPASAMTEHYYDNILFNGFCYQPGTVLDTYGSGTLYHLSRLTDTIAQEFTTTIPNTYAGNLSESSNTWQQPYFQPQLQSVRITDSIDNDNNDGYSGENNDNGNTGNHNDDDNTHSNDHHNNGNLNNGKRNNNHNKDNYNKRSFANLNDMYGGVSSEAHSPIFPVPRPGSSLQGSIPLTTLPQTTTLNIQSCPGNAKKRRKFEEQERVKVGRVRKLGACLLCKIYKLGCDEGFPCSNCQKVKDAQRIYCGPCVRPRLDKALTFRAGDGDNGTVDPSLPTFQWLLGVDVKTVKLEWPFRTKFKNAPTFSVVCKKFHPQKENLSEEYTVDGLVQKVDFPPWACHDTDAAQKNIEHFMTACQRLLEDEIRDSMRDPILQWTFEEAIRYRDCYKTRVLTYALQLYTGAMLNSRYPISAEGNVFGGTAEQKIPTPYFFEDLPLPPQLTFQIQTMIMFAMVKIQKPMLKELKALIFARDRVRHWYEVYLAISILLATLEWVYHIQIRFLAAKQGISECNFTTVSYTTQCMLDEWEESAFNLVAHFRCIMKGEVPFSQLWEKGDENPRRTGLDNEALEYIRKIKQEIESRREELEGLRKLKGKSRFGKPLAAVCELFLPTDD